MPLTYLQKQLSWACACFWGTGESPCCFTPSKVHPRSFDIMEKVAPSHRQIRSTLLCSKSDSPCPSIIKRNHLKMSRFSLCRVERRALICKHDVSSYVRKPAHTCKCIFYCIRAGGLIDRVCHRPSGDLGGSYVVLGIWILLICSWVLDFTCLFVQNPVQRDEICLAETVNFTRP